MGPHCDERDACNPTPCLNNGVCVDLTQAPNSLNYTCVCPYGMYLSLKMSRLVNSVVGLRKLVLHLKK